MLLVRVILVLLWFWGVIATLPVADYFFMDWHTAWVLLFALTWPVSIPICGLIALFVSLRYIGRDG